jgi:hypothetical protein
MAGFGKTLANAVVGGLAGYGDYLTKTGIIEEESKQDAVKAGRAMALEEFRAKMQGDRDATLNQYDRENKVLTGAINRSNNQAEIETKGKLDEASDRREYDLFVKKEAVRFKYLKEEKGIDLSNAQKRALFESEVRTKEEVKKEGMKKTGEVIDEKTGTLVQIYQDGDGRIRNYDTGVVVQSKSETNPFTNTVTRNTAAPTKKATAGWRDEPAPAAGGSGGQRSDLQIAMDQIATDYSSGRAITNPRTGKKLTVQEAQALARKRYGG